MPIKNKLAVAALAGLFATSVIATNPAFAGNHDKGSCKSASGCKGNAGTEKTNCKSTDSKEKHNCKSESTTDKSSCTTKSDCKSKSE